MAHSASSHGSFLNDPYFRILALLLFLTGVTVAQAKMSALHFGEMNFIFAMILATTKAVIVLLFFMHLKEENSLIWLYAAFPVVLLFVLIGGVFIDNPTRSHATTGASFKEYIGESLSRSPLMEKRDFGGHGEGGEHH